MFKIYNEEEEENMEIKYPELFYGYNGMRIHPS